MKVDKTNLRPLIRPLNVKKVTVLWCDDSWTYIPALKIRRKFSHASSFLNYTEEVWDTSIPANVLYEETVVHTMYSTSPKIWTEHLESTDPMGFIDCFKEIA